jgi:hypothetical protein
MPLEPSQADLYPLIRGGGVFLVAAGISIVIGAFSVRARYAILAAGSAIGGVATAILAAPLAAPFGPPDLVQVVSLIVAVAVEFIVLMPVLRAWRAHDERHTTLAILTIVGGHFVLMAPAFGPLVVLLAGASVLNTLTGLLWRGYGLAWLWGLDGLLKAATGTLMFFGHKLSGNAGLSWLSP